MVKSYINHLTLSHYEKRAQEAHQAQSVLRGIVAAARAVERERKQRDIASRRRAFEKALSNSTPKLKMSSSLDQLPTFAAPSAVRYQDEARTSSRTPADPKLSEMAPSPTKQTTPSEVERKPPMKDRWSKFFTHLDGLSGALEFGAGFDDAGSLAEARQLAAKIFGILKRQPQLVNLQG